MLYLEGREATRRRTPVDLTRSAEVPCEGLPLPRAQSLRRVGDEALRYAQTHSLEQVGSRLKEVYTRLS